MSDTNTQLSPSRDVEDQSLITQSDGSTQAKRSRVVVGDDDGGLVETELRGGARHLLVSSLRLEAQNAQILECLQAMNQKLAKIAGVLP